MRIQTTYCNHTNNPNTTEIRFNPSYERIIIQTLFRTHHSARQLTCFCTKYMRHQFCFQKNTYFLNNKHNSTRDTLHAHKHFKLLFSWNHTCHVYLTEIPGEKFQIFIQRGRNMKFLSVFCFFASSFSLLFPMDTQIDGVGLISSICIFISMFFFSSCLCPYTIL